MKVKSVRMSFEVWVLVATLKLAFVGLLNSTPLVGIEDAPKSFVSFLTTHTHTLV
jgi:hypothetical protein